MDVWLVFCSARCRALLAQVTSSYPPNVPSPFVFYYTNVAVEQREMFIFALCYNMKLELYELGTQRALTWKPLCLRGLVSERLLYAMLTNM